MAEIAEKKVVAKKTAPQTKTEVKKSLDLDVASVVEDSGSSDKTRFEAIEKQLNALLELNKNLSRENETLRSKPTTNLADRWIVVVHLCDRVAPLTTYIKTHNLSLSFGKYGETATLRFTDFEELLREYRDYFDRNVIGLTATDEDICNMYNLNKSFDTPLNAAVLKSMISISDEEVKRIYNSVAQTQKDVIVREFCTGYYELGEDGTYPKNKAYNNMNRAELLNKLSDGQMKPILQDMESKGIKSK